MVPKLITLLYVYGKLPPYNLDSLITQSVSMDPRRYCEPVRDKTNNLDIRPGLTQTGLYKLRKELEA